MVEVSVVGIDRRGHGQGVLGGHGDGAGACIRAADSFFRQRNCPRGGIMVGGSSGARVQ
jgi:hypothetical protein